VTIIHSPFGITVLSGSQKVSTNKDQLKELEVKLEAILEIVKKYQQHGGIDALQHRIKNFCQYVGSPRSHRCDVHPQFSSVIELQVDSIKHLQSRSVGSRIAEGSEDADKIVKAFRTMCTLCDVFQVSIQITESATRKLIAFIDGHTAEY
jgi:hypothetical protein